MTMSTATAIRPPAVAGMFYPGEPDTLRDDLATCLAVPPAPTFSGRLKAVIVPHAGYVYSGGTAGKAYALLAPLAGRIRRVVLLGPCHRVAVRGVAAPTVQAFATPLGNIPLDRAALDALADLPQVVASDAAHAQEHSLEVQLPFLQTVLGDFTLVPLAVGQTGAAEVAQVIARLWGGPETLIVISSDLSHFHGYAEAQKIDHATADHILALEQLTSFEQACGALPINGLIAVARSAACASSASPNAIRAIPPATRRAWSVMPRSRCMNPKPPPRMSVRPCWCVRAMPSPPASGSRRSPNRRIRH
jgi:AmmeMemoRadiSam system protein B